MEAEYQGKSLIKREESVLSQSSKGRQYTGIVLISRLLVQPLGV